MGWEDYELLSFKIRKRDEKEGVKLNAMFIAEGRNRSETKLSLRKV